MKLKLLPKFVLSLGVLGVALTVTISLFSYLSSKEYLEEMYAQRVISGSKSVAAMLDITDVRRILGPGGENSEEYRRVEAMLNTLKKDGDITYLSLVIPDEDSVTFYIDTCVQELGDDPANKLAYGTNVLYTEAAYDEIDLQKYYDVWDLYAENKGTDKPLVTDNSYGYNYTAVSPILDEKGEAIAEIQYILDMQKVRDHLNSFLYTMLGISCSIICIALLLYMMLVKWMVLNPVEKLSRFTTEIIQSGDFKKQEIVISTRDEIEDLGNSFNVMLKKLETYIDKRHIAIVMADVSGKGVPAALFMVIGKTLIKDHTKPGRDLGEVFTEVNNILCESNDNGMFITAFEGVLDLVTGEFRYVNAGHEKPFIYRKGKGYEAYKIRPGFVLAGMENIRYKEQMIQLDIGDKVFQYTDGVTEAMNKDNQLYGMDRLHHILNQQCQTCSPEKTLELVKADIDAFAGDNNQSDDITMLCLEYTKKMEG